VLEYQALGARGQEPRPKWLIVNDLQNKSGAKKHFWLDWVQKYLLGSIKHFQIQNIYLVALNISI
tara:strand:- start:453 stop:647 length:195 start_codon:yes stop_codon:yes gene_type:complete